MSDEAKAKPPTDCAVDGSEKEAGVMLFCTFQDTTEIPPRQAIQKRQWLDPKAGALVKLDVCERRLHLANTTGDSDTWARFYLAWLKLHALAFSYGRWVRESSDG